MSAATAARDATDRACTSAARSTLTSTNTLAVAAEHRYGADRLAALADTAERLVPGL
ncbi:hypothetical protein [Nocardia terpenica]|uniref:hypothetical protein n=1 Tax=Nocardia terpenica TaxID=455432 RepID=UPI000318826F|nr:hypothetical protein [Nocardia terpenica]NQE88934.1 hypothetical protein [Nocardia terpenica]